MVMEWRETLLINHRRAGAPKLTPLYARRAFSKTDHGQNAALNTTPGCRK